ncbi:MAG: DUF6036 family nucleotidyltransferase [Clostridiales bacterium]|nr:DUF6036 family nucleotidyltransferase [Clostridiales bacterium]
MSADTIITKGNLHFYLKELAKEYRKRSGGVRAEMILIGGASVLVNYGFREMTTDIDVIYAAPSVMKDAIRAVGDRLGLREDWLNTDFMRTDSYTSQLVLHSVYYRTYANVLEIRTVRAEYLLAMKLVSGRRYKKDLSDIVGILIEQEHAGRPLTCEMIDKAVVDLYGNWDRIDDFSKAFLDRVLAAPDMETLFLEQCEEEAAEKEVLLETEKNQPGSIRKYGVNAVVEAALAKKKK